MTDIIVCTVQKSTALICKSIQDGVKVCIVYNCDNECVTLSMATNKSRVSFVIPEDTKKELEKIAKLEGRSVSNYVLYVVQKAIAQAKEQSD